MPARLAAGRGGARLGSAQAQWNDYAGTAAAAILDARSLYEVVGLVRDRWAIAGFDFSLADSVDHVVAYAVDRASIQVRDHRRMAT